jgi:hypothetical protein
VRAACLVCLVVLALGTGVGSAAHAFPSSERPRDTSPRPAVSGASSASALRNDIPPEGLVEVAVPPTEGHSGDTRPITIAEQIELPYGVMLFVESGCWACDGPPGPLYRVFRTPGGDLRIERIFVAEMASNSMRPLVVRYQVSAEDGALIALVCTKGYCGGLGAADTDAEVTVYRSNDLGASWSEDRTLRTDRYPLGITPEGVFAIQAVDGTRSYGARNLDTGALVLPPGIPEVAFPLPLSQGLFWLSEDRHNAGGVWRQTSALYRGDGLPLAPGLPDVAFSEVIFDRMAPAAIFGASSEVSPGDPHFYVIDLRDPASHPLSTGFFMMGGAVLDGSRLITSMDLERAPMGPHYPQPGILDLDTAVFNPIAGLAGAGLGRSLIRAVVVGAFARVSTPPGGCAMLNTAPRPIATHLACLPDGAIVTLLGDRRWYRGDWWLSAALPDGRSGWLSPAYLER